MQYWKYFFTFKETKQWIKKTYPTYNLRKFAQMRSLSPGEWSRGYSWRSQWMLKTKKDEIFLRALEKTIHPSSLIKENSGEGYYSNLLPWCFEFGLRINLNEGLEKYCYMFEDKNIPLCLPFGGRLTSLTEIESCPFEKINQMDHVEINKNIIYSYDIVKKESYIHDVPLDPSLIESLFLHKWKNNNFLTKEEINELRVFCDHLENTGVLK